MENRKKNFCVWKIEVIEGNRNILKNLEKFFFCLGLFNIEKEMPISLNIGKQKKKFQKVFIEKNVILCNKKVYGKWLTVSVQFSWGPQRISLIKFYMEEMTP